MDKLFNPFPVKGYFHREYFCDRDTEIQTLFVNIQNNIDTTLISPRRMGKTGLIYRFFEFLKDKDTIKYVYADIFPTRNLSDFIKILAESILKQFSEKTSLGSRFLEFIKGFRPLISYDTLTGQPQVQINYQSSQEKEYSLQGLFQFLDSFNEPMVIAIDEFQQITEYPEKNIEALLRTHTQNLKNIRFIFCGSRKSIMVQIFSNTRRPFYASTQFLMLDEIDRDTYISFIKSKFNKAGRQISDNALSMILDWSKGHTFYVQSVCNMIFSFSVKKNTLDTVKQACIELLKRNEPVFFQYRQLLTHAQWNYLIAIAKEGEVKQLTAQKFIARYEIGTPANSRRLCKSLVEKELILEVTDRKETVYRLYDVFLSRWMENEY
ncbi:MAG: hypothetical protein CVU05_14845 [Bacteroidetes bacterium HGW-Bacteroidetes-21]|jgi:hypothetical protein|nr:MAG: hypothetical protein CVU05_14845 [Bacteroidetes bacterium HGW-Bacteroidetes-21]